MRDQRFVAVHRGGPLEKVQHRQLMAWARACAQHVLPLIESELDPRLEQALLVAQQWELGNCSVGDAQQAAWGAHACARELAPPAAVLVARAVGHAAATAHMADHALGAALYALKAVDSLDGFVNDERGWQDDQLPAEIRELVISASCHSRFGKFARTV